MQQSRNLERPPLCFRLLWSIMLEMQGVPFHAFVGKYNNEETYRCWQSWHVNQSENPPLHRPHDDTSWNYSSAFLDIRKLMIAQGMLYFCAYYTITKDEKIVEALPSIWRIFLSTKNYKIVNSRCFLFMEGNLSLWQICWKFDDQKIAWFHFVRKEKDGTWPKTLVKKAETPIGAPRAVASNSIYSPQASNSKGLMMFHGPKYVLWKCVFRVVCVFMFDVRRTVFSASCR